MEARRLPAFPLALLVALLCGCGDPGRSVPPERWSVIFLNVELLRADFVGLIDSASDATPNIDRFFREALIFEDVSAPGGETAGSSSAVLSALEGLYFPIDLREARELGYVPALRAQKARHADRIVGIAEVLEREGFLTVNVNQGRRSGRGIGFDAGFQRYVEIPHRTRIEEPLRALEQELERVRDETAFVLFHPNSLHAAPYRYPPERERILAGPIRCLPAPDGLDLHLDLEGVEAWARSALARAVYRQQLRYVDDALGRLFALLEEHHVDDTIVVLYSNHGEGLHDNGVAYHGVSYQSCVRVPLLIRHPRLRGPIRIRQPVSLIDLAPTIYAWLGIRVEHLISGVSLLPLIEGGPYEREHIFGRGMLDRYVRRGRWKLITGPGDELYDLDADPREERDLSAEHPAIVDRLRVILSAAEREVSRLALR